MAIIAELGTVTVDLNLNVDTQEPAIGIDVEVADSNPLGTATALKMLAAARRRAADELDNAANPATQEPTP